jgi:hypothetical protein
MFIVYKTKHLIWYDEFNEADRTRSAEQGGDLLLIAREIQIGIPENGILSWELEG